MIRQKLKYCFFSVILFILIYILFFSVFFNNVVPIKAGLFSIFLAVILNWGFVYIIYKFLIIRIKNEKIILIFVFSLLIIFQVCFSYIFVVNPTWDFGTVFNAINDSINNTKGLFVWDYFYRYDNNLPLALFFRVVFGFFSKLNLTNFLYLGIFLNIIFIDISIFFVYKISKMLFKKNVAYCFLIFSCTVTPFITYTPIFYTDTITLPFISGAIYCFFKYIWYEQKRIYLALCGVLIGIGSCFKITTIFILIAIFVFQIFNGKEKFNLELIKKVLIITVTCVLPLLMLSALKGYKMDYKKVDALKFPITHWIMMGLNSENYGGYLRSDVDYTVSFPSIEEKKRANIEQIKARISQHYERGELINFFTNKLVKVWGDGSFYAVNKLRREPLKNYNFKKYIIGNEDESVVFNSIAQSQIIMILTFVIVSILNRKKMETKKEECLFFCSIIIFGLILFFLIWESRSRYIVNYIPILLLCLFIGVDFCYNWFIKKESDK